MMSPFRNRIKGSNKAQSNWLPVTADAGETRGTMEFEGSLRAMHKNKRTMRIKGKFVLERWSGIPTQYRISYNGFHADTEADAVGAIHLPRTHWNPVASKGVSNNMKARLLMMTFDSKASTEGLTQVQITIPVLDGGHRAAKTAFEAFIAASIEMNAGEELVGPR